MAAPATRHEFVSRGLRLSYLDSAPGDTTRPVVLLLHGFPDTAEMWADQIAALHHAGYRCLAPDTIGCGQSQIAARRTDYNIRSIVDDHWELLRQLGIQRCDVVGHDIGAVSAWLLAGYHPGAVRRLAVMSVGHPMAYARAGLDQKRAGWYIAYFTMAGIAERLLPGRGPLSLRRVFGSHPDIEGVLRRLSAPGRLTAAVRVYRASLVTVLVRKQPRVAAPTLGIWSDRDAFLVESQMRNSVHWVDGTWTFEAVPGGHWIPLEQPDYLNRRLLQFLAPATVS
ncbi:alpha/beta fold hydrolase [Mycobacterium sp. Y57]|uniref:alpha/beta fold hydrolase n=1 Tax=Mycolicibacterium xanthum TaxID=2796469 RepID=UPI001C85F64A|nr:alpha/beta fold hydrolase [Mycolicibacterium xanthum]MBX7433969.1 alpha/beta fold hydrolase [Mycolicibacterium xanthum]